VGSYSREPLSGSLNTLPASGAGTLVGAEAPDDAALDDDGALGAVFACDDARGRSCYRATGLLDFSQHVFIRQSHQRRGDFRLLLLIVGDPDRGEDRLLQRRRIPPDAPCAVFRVPVFAHRGLAYARG